MSSRRLGRRKTVTLKRSWRRLQDVFKINKCLLEFFHEAKPIKPIPHWKQDVIIKLAMTEISKKRWLIYVIQKEAVKYSFHTSDIVILRERSLKFNCFPQLFAMTYKTLQIPFVGLASCQNCKQKCKCKAIRFTELVELPFSHGDESLANIINSDNLSFG